MNNQSPTYTVQLLDADDTSRWATLTLAGQSRANALVSASRAAKAVRMYVANFDATHEA